MHAIVEIILGNTVVALLLAAAALLAGLLKRPPLAHALWLLVLIKLITPPIIRAPVALPASPPLENEAAVTLPTETAAETVAPNARVAPIDLPPVETIAVIEIAPPPLQSGWLVPSRGAIAAAAWIAGTLCFTVWLGVRIVRLRPVLRAAAPADAVVEQVVARLASRIGLRRLPDVRLIDAEISPLVCSLGRRPILLLPRAITLWSASGQRDAIIAHELAHLKRRDHWVRWLELLATAALWWHPLVWLARWRLREAEEQCCDAWAVSMMSDAPRRTYAEALVEAVKLFPRDSARLSPVASGIGQFNHLKRRIDMIMKHQPGRTMSPAWRVLVVAMFAALPVVPALAQETATQKDEELQQLRERVQQLEERLAKAQAELAAAKASTAAAQEQAAAQQQDEAATREQIDAQKNKARARSRQDAKKYQPEQMAEAEQLYQVANKNWRAPEAIVSLKQMIEKYPDVNRTGCAVLYLGQMSQGDTREEYLKRAVEKHSDCYYFNGVQVGGYGRYLLALYYHDIGRIDEAKKLLEELINKYPDALTHRQQRLVPSAKKALASMSGASGPTQPAAQ
jgi:beta-lactamase regulating signal transducer with metallopeptidase domain